MSKRLITSYVGFPTFFDAPIKKHDQVQEGMVVVAGVPIDQGVVTARPGARYGPRGIREASMLFRGAYEVAGENTLGDMETRVFMRPKKNANFAGIFSW